MIYASPGQRRLLNKLVQVIAEYTGNDFRDVKVEAKLRAVRRGYPLMKDSEGCPIIDEWGREVPESETQITMEEATALIEELYQLSAETGALFNDIGNV